MPLTFPFESLSRRQWLVTGAALFATTVNGQDTPDDQAPDQGPDSESLPPTSTDQEATSAPSRLSYDSPQIQNWRIGLILETPVTCTNVFATFAVPMEWPEQNVTVTGQTIDPPVSGWETRDLLGGCKQVALRMARVPANSTVEMTFQFRIERSRVLPPQMTDDLVIPARRIRDFRMYYGNSPHIDTSDGRIKKVARDLLQVEVPNDWARVEQIYDYVRENVEYVEGPIRNASDALRDGRGDCEDMTSLFVAVCRNADIPARMVWIPDHCYPEFYLEDPEGNGTWFPCQAAGTRQFGQMDEYRPVLQKGDFFKVAEKRTPVRYVSEFFKCDRQGRGTPKPKFVREMIDL